MKVAIVTDTNSGISKEQAEELGVFVVPMPFLIDGEEFYENENLSVDQFYDKLLQGSMVSTSQPSIYSITKLWKKILKDYDELVYIPMSSGLSASCNSATAAAKDFDNRVQVVDNKRISVPQKRSVLDAVELAREGKTAKEIKQWLEKTASKSSIYIMINNLKYLKRGGRITPAAAAIGTLLKIKPVLTIQGDKLDKFAQVISVNVAKKRMIDQIEKELLTRFKDDFANNSVEIAIAHTNCEDKAREFELEANKMLEKYNLKVTMFEELSLSIACHTGDGCIGIAIIVKK